MDVNIKYKKIDKLPLIEKAIKQGVIDCTPWGTPEDIYRRQSELIEAVYEQDHKQIERVEIGNCKNAVAGMDIEVFKDMARIGIRVGFKTQFMETKKTGLDEIIKVLTDISNQLEG
jgi:hypothetical protein